jgi:hypothetical protein
MIHSRDKTQNEEYYRQPSKLAIRDTQEFDNTVIAKRSLTTEP